MYCSSIMFNPTGKFAKLIVFGFQSVSFLLLVLLVFLPLLGMIWLTLLTEMAGYNFSEEV